MMNFIKTNENDHYKAIVCRYVRTQFNFFRKGKATTDNIKKYRSIVLWDKYAPKKTRLACCLSYCGFWLVKIVWNIAKRESDG